MCNTLWNFVLEYICYGQSTDWDICESSCADLRSELCITIPRYVGQSQRYGQSLDSPGAQSWIAPKQVCQVRIQAYIVYFPKVNHKRRVESHRLKIVPTLINKLYYKYKVHPSLEWVQTKRALFALPGFFLAPAPNFLSGREGFILPGLNTSWWAIIWSACTWTQLILCEMSTWTIHEMAQIGGLHKTMQTLNIPYV